MRFNQLCGPEDKFACFSRACLGKPNYAILWCDWNL